MRKLLFFIAASFAAHALAVSSFYLPFPHPRKSDETSVTIFYKASPEAPKKLESPKEKKAPVKKIAAVSKPQVLETSKAAKPKIPLIRKSADLLADPEKGKVFSSYFGKIKEKIHRAVQKTPHRHLGRGKVSLVFILNFNGDLEGVFVDEQGTEAGFAEKDFAVGCVKASAPFTPFPRELDFVKISFNVTLLFEES